MTDEPLNHLGDRLVPTTGNHGADIGSQRLDDLDRRSLTDVLARVDQPVCVDLGCGLGSQGLRFALLGAEVHLYDLLPEPAWVSALRRELSLALSWHAGDLQQLTAAELPARINLVYSQRCLHYLPLSAAERLLVQLAALMPPGARCHVSVSGLESELGGGYAGASLPLAARFHPLSAAMQAKHGITHPVCLYTVPELTSLLTAAGFAPLEVSLSAFGNVKGSYERR